MFFNAIETLPAFTTSATATAITTKSDPSYVGVSIQALGGDLYYGDAAVTTSTGQKLKQNETVTFATKSPHLIYVIAAGSYDVRVALFKGTR
jgi:hypothetical protein